MKTQLSENEKRNNQLREAYDPAAGIGCSGDRTDCGGYHLPVALMEEHPDYGQMTTIGQERVRIHYDFEYWCWRCVKITDKMSGMLVPFVLNRPQRRLLGEMERQRRAGQPVRIILLKARQWGGSTLVQVYIAWLQLVVYKGKNSIIVGHKRNSSFAIKQMLRTILLNYPKQFLDDEQEALKLVNVRESKDIQEISGRDCSICLTSSYSPDAARGLNLSFAHLSEVAFWNSNRNIDPNDLIRTVTGTIPLVTGTVIVMESTANGMNSFFYNEWQRAREGKSAFSPVFVAWNEIDLYRKELDENFTLDDCDDYERALWDKGCTLEQIYWYHEKRKEFSEHNLMKAEFPSDDKEAFENSMEFVFSQHEQEQIVENVSQPLRVDENGLMIWQEPKPENVVKGKGRIWSQFPARPHRSRYLAVLTIGSDSDERYPSVLSIWETRQGNQLPTLAAQWVGVKPLNILAIMAVNVATRYNTAKLAIENNDLWASENSRQQGVFVKNEIFEKYRNLYYDKKKGAIMEIDKKNYSLMFYELILSARNALYLELDSTAARTIAKMILLPNGRYYAEKSEHQNYLVNRAEALFIMREIELTTSSDTVKYNAKDFLKGL